tara:strand:+ start:293 stop:1084 length:792 start_codon:yes stop_codon:yes gene_type:complete
MLASKNPFRGDDDIVFEAKPLHKYTVRGKRVPISVTALGARAVPQEHRFNGAAIVKNNLSSWRANATNKHHSLVNGVSDSQAEKNVFASWNKNRDLGTGLHKCIEQFLNGETVENEEEYAVEMAQFHDAMQQLSDLTPLRTEMSVFANDAAGNAAVAGQIDLLARDADGGIHIVDWKRAAGDLSPGAFSFGKSFLDDMPLNDHYKYSLQLSLYAAMFELQTGTPVVSTRLVQIHPDFDSVQIIPATDLRGDARNLLEGAGVAF